MKIDAIFGQGTSSGTSHPDYAAAALAAECEKVRTVHNGTRNNTLNVAAFNIGQIVGAGMVGRHEAEGSLLAAAIESGLEAAEARSAIASGLDGGAKKPRSNRAEQTHSGRTGKATDRDKKKHALKIWGEAVPAAGTPVENYLKSRGIDGELPVSLRYHPQVRMAGCASPVPAMIALLTNPITGEFVAIQRTALAADGSGKADISNPKQTLGSMDDGAVVLGDVTSAGLIVEGEGIETTASAAQAFGVPGIAVLGATRLGKPDLPAGVNSVLLADRGSEAAARQGARRRHDQGRQAWTATPPEGFKDFNDVLRSENGAAIIVECIKNATPFEPSPDEDFTEASTEAFTDVFDDEIADEAEPDFSVIERTCEPAPPLPLDFLGDLRGVIAAVAQTKSAPVDYVAMSLLCSCAGLIGATRRVTPWPGWDEPARLWFMLVGSPSAGKTPAMLVFTKLIAKLERALAVEHETAVAEYKAKQIEAKSAQDAWEKQAKEVADCGGPVPPRPRAATEPDEPAPARLYMNDATIEVVAKLLSKNVRGLLLYRDELGAWLANLEKYGDGDRAFFCETYNGAPYSVDRKGEGKSLYVPTLLLSIFGGIQPDRLQSLLMQGADDGMAARFLMSWPDPVAPCRPTSVVDENVFLRIFERLLKVDFKNDPVNGFLPMALSVDEPGVAAFQSWRERHYADSKSVSGMMASAWGKMPGQALSLALVVEFLRWAAMDDNEPQPTIVSQRSVITAIELIEGYFKPMARRTYGDAAMPKSERDAATLGREIVKRGPDVINVRDVRRKWGLSGFGKASNSGKGDGLDAAISVLVELGLLTPIGGRHGSTPGRQRADFKVHEAVLRRGK